MTFFFVFLRRCASGAESPWSNVNRVSLSAVVSDSSANSHGTSVTKAAFSLRGATLSHPSTCSKIFSADLLDLLVTLFTTFGDFSTFLDESDYALASVDPSPTIFAMLVSSPEAIMCLVATKVVYLITVSVVIFTSVLVTLRWVSCLVSTHSSDSTLRGASGSSGDFATFSMMDTKVTSAVLKEVKDPQHLTSFSRSNT